MAPAPGAALLTLEGNVRAAWSDASRGDLRPAGHGTGDGATLAGLAAELSAGTGGVVERVAWMTQVHGAEVRTVDVVASHGGGGGMPGLMHMGEGDALVAMSPAVALCILTADCAPIALASPEGIFGAVHAGWTGLLHGVVEATVARMRSLGASEVTAALGPCIHAPCYEFSPGDLDVVEAAYGPTVRTVTSDGSPALDLVAGVSAAVTAADALMVEGIDVCTACGTGHFYHRARADRGRQALLVWSLGPREGS